MKQKWILLLLLLAVFTLPAHAVLKEKDLNQTLSVLKSELKHAVEEQVKSSRRFESNYKRQNKRMNEIMDESNKTALVLYSQQADFVFDQSYACHEAAELYHDFNSRLRPFSKWSDRMDVEIERYEQLINSLESMQDFILTDSSMKADRNECIRLATTIRDKLIQNRNRVKSLQAHHDQVEKRLKELHDYAEERYGKIRQNIFVNGDQDYLTVLKTFSLYRQQARNSLMEKYQPSLYSKSSWRGPIILFLFAFVVVWFGIAIAASYIIIRWLVPKSLRDEKFRERRPCLVWCFSMVAFALVVMVLRYFFMSDNYFFQMASELLIEFAWLMSAMLISLLVRMWKHPERIMRGFRIYAPIFFLGFVVIVFRIIFIPNEVVHLIFPPMLIVCTIWQALGVYIHNNNESGKISKSDYFYAYLSLGVVIFCTAAAWEGYALLAVQVLIWWYMQLTCIQTITCVYTLLHLYQGNKQERKMKKAAEEAKAKGEKFNKDNYKMTINQTWFYDFIYMAFVPILSVFSPMMSIYWAAEVFDLTEIILQVFRTRYINVDGIISLSIMTLSIVIALFFLVRYLLYFFRETYTLQYKKRNGDKKMVGIGMNVVTIIVWGIYAIISMRILGISNTGLVAAVGGMSTGIGFAMKDTIENLFYGISLMTGRVKIGDVIELDGVRGRVANITYQSTMVEAIDGSVMSFLNSQLFTQNFKNLTKNHGYEVVKVPVGVAYGTDVKLVRQLLQDRISQLDCYNKKRGIQLLFDNFGDNSVDLILVVWVPVVTKLAAVAQLKEVIYDTFNANNIEIPFPQRDIYVHKMPNMLPGTPVE